MQKEIERLPKILVMLYTCTFLVFLIEIHHQKHYPDLSQGVMSLSVCLEIASTLKTRKNISFKRIRVGQDYFWIWVAIESIDKVILGTYRFPSYYYNI
jgi:hypothetical protein